MLVAYYLNDNVVYKLNKSFILLEQAAENDIWNREWASESGLYPSAIVSYLQNYPAATVFQAQNILDLAYSFDISPQVQTGQRL